MISVRSQRGSLVNFSPPPTHRTVHNENFAKSVCIPLHARPLGPLGFNFFQHGPTTRPSRRKDCRESIYAFSAVLSSDGGMGGRASSRPRSQRRGGVLQSHSLGNPLGLRTKQNLQVPTGVPRPTENAQPPWTPRGPWAESYGRVLHPLMTPEDPSA